MLKKIVLNLVRKYAISAVQDAVKSRGKDVAHWSLVVGWWVAKTRLVVAYLERIAARLADGELSDGEAEACVEEVRILADEVMRPMEDK